MHKCGLVCIDLGGIHSTALHIPALGIKILMSKHTVISTHCEIQWPETQYRAVAHVTVLLHNEATVGKLNWAT